MAVNVKTNSNSKTLAETSNISNPNLLINSNFKINQRGQSTYDLTPFNTVVEYTVDRWSVTQGKVIVNDDNTVTIQPTTSNGMWFTQKLENKIEGKVTLSYKVKSITGDVYITNNTDRKISTTGIHYLTIEDIEEFNFFIPYNSSITLEWCKLEKGSIATPYVEPDPILELAKCKYYYTMYNLDTMAGFFSETMLYFNITGNEMRTNATGTFKNKTINYGIDSKSIEINTVSVYKNSLDMHAICSLKSSATSGGLQPFRGVTYFEMDAEIY